MLKYTLTVIILFIYLNAFTLSCENIIQSESTELLISLGESLYKGKLNIDDKMKVTKESNYFIFPESSKLKVGDLTLIVISCKTDNHKSYLTVKYKLQPEFDLEIHSQGASIMDYNSDLSEQKLLEFLNFAQKPEEKKSLFNKSNKKNKQNFRKTDGQFESEDESEDQDLQSSTKKAKVTSVPELTTNEFNQQPSVQPYSKILTNPSLCGKLLEHGSGLYKFCTANRCNTIYLYSVDYIKYWYSTQDYLIENRKEIPDNIFSSNKYILKSCHDVKSQKFENSSEIMFEDYKHFKKDTYASSVEIIKKADFNYVSKLYTNDLDKPGTYELYDYTKASLGRLIIKSDPYNIIQTHETDYNILILYGNTDTDKNKTYLTSNSTQTPTTIKHIDFKYNSSKGYYSMEATTLGDKNNTKKIQFNFFKKLEDDISSSSTINQEYQITNDKVYKDNLNEAIDKLQLPHFENENFCAKLFFPNKYIITYTNNNEIELNVFKLMEITYIPDKEQIAYFFVNEQNQNYSCIYSRNGSKLNGNYILSIQENHSRSFYIDTLVANFISIKSKCYNLINPGDYKVFSPNGNNSYAVSISSVSKIKYSLVTLTLFIEYKDSKVSNWDRNSWYKSFKYPLDQCTYNSNAAYLILDLQERTKTISKIKFSEVIKLNKH